MTRQELWSNIETKYAEELKEEQWSADVDTMKLWFSNFINEERIQDCLHCLNESDKLSTFINNCQGEYITRKQKPQFADDKVPNLCFGLFEWLSWFRGYYYQVSHTHTGICTEAQGVYRLDALDNTISELEEINPNLYMMCNALAMLACISNMRSVTIGKALEDIEVREAVNTFLEKTISYVHPRLKNVPKFTSWFVHNIERTSHKDLDCLSGVSVELKTNRNNMMFSLSEDSICACFKYKSRYYVCKLKFADYLIEALEYFNDFEWQSFIGNALQALCALLDVWTCYEDVVPRQKLDVMDLAGTKQTFEKFDEVVKYLVANRPALN